MRRSVVRFAAPTGPGAPYLLHLLPRHRVNSAPRPIVGARSQLLRAVPGGHFQVRKDRLLSLPHLPDSVLAPLPPALCCLGSRSLRPSIKVSSPGSRVMRPARGAALHAGVSRAGVSAGPRVRRAPRRMVPGSAVLRTKPRTEDHASIECPLCLRVEDSGAFQTPNSKLQSWKILENLGKLVQARQTSGVAGISGEKVQRQW